MNKLNLIPLFCLLASAAFGQFNMTYVSNYYPNQASNDVWGYVAPDNTEYALLGVLNGVSVISLAVPSFPTEVAFSGGVNSGWRDMKTWGNYAYAINESGGGISVIDLSTLPDSINTTFFSPMVTVDTLTTSLVKGHNLFIDTDGYLYVVGGNVNAGGVLIFDLNSDPLNPPLAGLGPKIYSHDVYARNNLMYTSDIYAGQFSVIDISDKANPVTLASHSSPAQFTHNTWLSDSGNVLFTTDERANAPIASFDISDLNNITKLDEFRPLATLDKGVVPHNAHVLNDYVIASHYTDGVVVIDANKPDNLIEIAQYDTYSGADGGFSGCWGAYPFLPSGLVLASDRSTGLYVLQPNYVRACYLEGKVTELGTGIALDDAQVQILNTTSFGISDFAGDYKTGHPTPGAYLVEVSRPGYFSDTLSVNLFSGLVETLDVALVSLGAFKLKGLVQNAQNGQAVSFAKVLIYNANYQYELTTDVLGNFSIPDFIGEFYSVYAGKWGFKTTERLMEPINDTGAPYLIEIEEGYEDVFELDLGWQVSGTATNGLWERGEPIGTFLNGELANPQIDVAGDVGEQCYVTGNGAGNADTDNVDDGNSILRSPTFDLSGMNEPFLAYTTWFFNAGGSSAPDDYLKVTLSNGVSEVVLQTSTQSNSNWNSAYFVDVKQVITPTANMQISFEATDQGDAHIVEAAVDYFVAFDDNPITPVLSQEEEEFAIQISPNPFYDKILVEYHLKYWEGTPSQLSLYNSLGQLVEYKYLDKRSGQVELGKNLAQGLYFIQLNSGHKASKSFKVIKSR